jgi:dihydrofolate reductase
VIISLIVAAAANEVIGDRGDLPWHLPDDLRRFRVLTTGHAVVAGRATHESIMARRGRPLPGRTTVVVSRTLPAGRDGDVLRVSSLPAALAGAARITGEAGLEEFFVIGGASVYEQALPSVDRVYLTRVHREVPGDCALPAGWLAGFGEIGREDVAEHGTRPGHSWLLYQRAAG